MKRLGLFLLAAVMVAGAAGCGGGGDDEDDCMDVVQKACKKFYDCGFVLLDNGVPIDVTQCANVLYPNTAGQTDEQCRNEWSEGEDLACGDYYNWF